MIAMLSSRKYKIQLHFYLNNFMTEENQNQKIWIPSMETSQNIEYLNHMIIVHHHSPGSNSSRTTQRFIDGKPVYDFSGRSIHDCFHHERLD